LFRDRLKYEDGKWVFYDEDEVTAESIEAGAIEALQKKPYLMEPSNQGGSGAGGGADKGTATGISDAREKLAAATKAADGRKDDNLAKVIQARRALAEAEKGKKK